MSTGPFKPDNNRVEGLRWILLIIGLLIVGGIYYFGTRRDRAQARAERQQAADPASDPVPRADPAQRSAEPLDENLERELNRLGQLINEDWQPGSPGDAGAHPQAAAPAQEPEGAPVDLPSNPDKIVTLLLLYRGGGQLNGREIAEAAEKVGLTFGDHHIYHRVQTGDGHQSPIFSMANVVNPGTFDRDRPDHQNTPGVCLFLTLPNQLSALDAWDAMLAAGRRLSELLDIELLDENQSSLSRQRTASIREEMREYDRTHSFEPRPGTQ